MKAPFADRFPHGEPLFSPAMSHQFLLSIKYAPVPYSGFAVSTITDSRSYAKGRSLILPHRVRCDYHLPPPCHNPGSPLFFVHANPIGVRNSRSIYRFGKRNFRKLICLRKTKNAPLQKVSESKNHIFLLREGL